MWQTIATFLGVFSAASDAVRPTQIQSIAQIDPPVKGTIPIPAEVEQVMYHAKGIVITYQSEIEEQLRSLTEAKQAADAAVEEANVAVTLAKDKEAAAGSSELAAQAAREKAQQQLELHKAAQLNLSSANDAHDAARTAVAQAEENAGLLQSAADKLLEEKERTRVEMEAKRTHADQQLQADIAATKKAEEEAETAQRTATEKEALAQEALEKQGRSSQELQIARADFERNIRTSEEIWSAKQENATKAWAVVTARQDELARALEAHASANQSAVEAEKQHLEAKLEHQRKEEELRLAKSEHETAVNEVDRLQQISNAHSLAKDEKERALQDSIEKLGQVSALRRDVLELINSIHDVYSTFGIVERRGLLDKCAEDLADTMNVLHKVKRALTSYNTVVANANTVGRLAREPSVGKFDAVAPLITCGIKAVKKVFNEEMADVCTWYDKLPDKSLCIPEGAQVDEGLWVPPCNSSWLWNFASQMLCPSQGRSCPGLWANVHMTKNVLDSEIEERRELCEE